jgi:secondary thiamine-phosphate synthase enzyme
MKSIIHRIEIQTRHEVELINITEKIHRLVEDSGVKSGTAFILSMHTTTAITVNEGLPDLEADISNLIQNLVPDDNHYNHARYLPSDGQMAVNASSLVTGSRQTIYFVELDGPQYRTYVIQILGE